MSEIETSEPRLPIGLQLVLNQLERDRLIANAKRERSEYIAASLRKFAHGLQAFASQIRQTAADCSAARLHQQQ